MIKITINNHFSFRLKYIEGKLLSLHEFDKYFINYQFPYNEHFAIKKFKSYCSGFYWQ